MPSWSKKRLILPICAKRCSRKWSAASRKTDDSVPVRKGHYYYYVRTEEGKQYTIYCRKFQTLEADEEVLIDLNVIDDENDFDYLRMGIFDISPDHKLLAYGLDTTGAENLHSPVSKI